MVRRRGIMSDALKMEIARELGFYSPNIAHGDFGDVSSRNCGSMVRAAIQMAEKTMQYNR